VAQLQEYIDSERQSHYLEGNYSEYIMPNSTLFCRESSLYADVIGNEDADPVWSSPVREMVRFGGFEPASYQVANALAAFGGFTVPGLKILRDVWGEVNFEGDQNWSISRERAAPPNIYGKAIMAEHASCFQSACGVSATCYRRAEDSRVVPIVVAPFELGDIQREIFAAGAGVYEPARRWLSRIWRGRLYPSPRGDAARKEAVAKLHEQGLSQRQIAAAAGAITSMVPMRNQGWLILA
jgi:hypothetical protein